MDAGDTSLRPDSSLVLRLVRGAALWVLPILVFSAFALTWFYRTSTYRLFDEPLTSTITALVASVNVSEDKEITLSQEPVDPRFQQALSGQYWMIATLGTGGTLTPRRASFSLTDQTLVLPPEDIAFIRANPGAFVQSETNGPDVDDPLRAVVQSVLFPNMDGEPLIMLAAADVRGATRDVRNFAALAIALMAFVSLGLIVGIMTQVRLGLRPLFDLRSRVADVREGRATRVDGDYPQEIQPLATELNSLIDHNKDVVDQAKTHVSNLAHALKTPLAVLLNEADGSDTVSGDVVSRQSNSMKKQVDHHLQRARAAARGQAIGVSASVPDTLEPLARTLGKIYRSKDMAFDMDIAPDLLFRGEKRDLEEMAGNLMDNACKWTVSHVGVKASMAADDDTMLEICVTDNGPGMEPKHYADALKRGIRLDEATPGTGFGLAIVNDLAKAYKGGVTLAEADGGGLSVTLRLPRLVQ